MSKDHYDYLGKVSLGDKVEVSLMRNFDDVMFGEVISVSQMCCDIAYTDRLQGKGLLKFCWHADDPRMRTPGVYEESQRRNQDDTSHVITMGVFRPTHGQKLLNDLPRKIVSIESLLESVVTRLARVERELVERKDVPQGNARKPRGRAPGAPKDPLDPVRVSP